MNPNNSRILRKYYLVKITRSTVCTYVHTLTQDQVVTCIMSDLSIHAHVHTVCTHINPNDNTHICICTYVHIREFSIKKCQGGGLAMYPSAHTQGRHDPSRGGGGAEQLSGAELGPPSKKPCNYVRINAMYTGPEQADFHWSGQNTIKKFTLIIDCRVKEMELKV